MYHSNIHIIIHKEMENVLQQGHTIIIVRCHFMSQSDFCSMKIFTIDKRILDTIQFRSKVTKGQFQVGQYNNAKATWNK